MKLVSAISLFTLLVLFAPRAHACSCGMEKGTREDQVLEALNDAGVVFVARLRNSTLSPDKEYPDMIHEDALFVVIEVLKGPLFLGQPILVQQNVSAGTCGLSSTNDPVWIEDLVKPETELEEGVVEPSVLSKDWLIYSDGPGPYMLHQCSRTMPLNIEGDKDLKILREYVRHPPKWPVKPSLPADP